MNGVQERETAAWPRCAAAAEFFHVGASRTEFLDNREAAREQFLRFHAIHIATILEPSLLALALRLCDQIAFMPAPDAHTHEFEASPQRAGRILNLALNRAPLLRWLEDVTGCGAVHTIEGRLSQTSRPADQLFWHDDDVALEGRRLAFVINLAPAPFTGGEFQMREKTGAPVFEHRYEAVGSGLIFQVDKKLEHRVLPVTGGGPRRVFAGWAYAGTLQ